MLKSIHIMEVSSIHVIVLLPVLCSAFTFVNGACTDVVVSGSSVSFVNGFYTTTSAHCALRPSYQHFQNKTFLFHDGYGFWVIYSSVCTYSGHKVAFARVHDDAPQPDFITKTWEEKNDFSADCCWKERAELTITCTASGSLRVYLLIVAVPASVCLLWYIFTKKRCRKDMTSFQAWCCREQPKTRQSDEHQENTRESDGQPSPLEFRSPDVSQRQSITTFVNDGTSRPEVVLTPLPSYEYATSKEGQMKYRKNEDVPPSYV